MHKETQHVPFREESLKPKFVFHVQRNIHCPLSDRFGCHAFDTINVAQGTYAESIVVGKPLALVGHNSSNTIIDANGLPTGVYVDGLDNPGLSSVVVMGFTMKNANLEGIVITNASNVTVSQNNVINNNRSLDIQNGTCPGAPDWETLEGFDCGEGIHLSGVDHSLVTNNVSQSNAGGILLSDHTGPTHDNVISSNTVSDNPYDCGITLVSHPPATITGATSPFGVSHNTISGNTSSRNGTQEPGAGAGVGIFDSIPGTKNFGNVVIKNRLTNNGPPGVALHGSRSIPGHDQQFDRGKLHFREWC